MIMKLYEGEMYSINHGRHCVRRKFIKSERERQFEDVLPGRVGGGGGCGMGAGWMRGNFDMKCLDVCVRNLKKRTYIENHL